jgi:hypothetical protein
LKHETAEKYEYNLSEFNRGLQITQDQMDRDMQDGELNKFMVQAMQKPDALSHWNKSKYDKIEKAEKAMKNRKRKRQR